VAGTTYFVPVNELSALYINILLAAFDPELGYFVVDERRRFAPAGLGRFARVRGGHLYDNPRAGRFTTIAGLESWLYEFTAIEQGPMLQTLGLMAEALGLGGAAHFAAHPYAWPQELGFDMEQIAFSKLIGAGPLASWVLKLLRRDMPVPTALGLSVGGEAVLSAWCPPRFRTMREAVLAYVDYKF